MTWHLADPEHAALRKAARAALVMTAMTAVGHVVVDNASFAMFASFASLALIMLADFGGPLRVRFGLGIAFTVTGAGLVTLGTLASGHLVTAILMMFAAGFVVTFAGVFGGYAAAGGRGLLLAAILSVMVPAKADVIPDRVAGWVLAGLAGSAALVLLWPERPRHRTRLGLASIALDLASAVRSTADGAPAHADRIAGELATLRETVDSSLVRPGGPRSRDQALLYLVDELGRTEMFVRRLELRAGSVPLTAADRAALGASADALESAAAVLNGDDVDPRVAPVSDVRRAEATRFSSLLDEKGAEGGPADGAAVMAQLDVLFPIRMLTYLSLSISTNALLASGRPPGDTSFEFQTASPTLHRGRRQVVDRFVATIRANLRPSSRWFRSSMRVATALAVSAAIAESVDPSHAFWVVLGTLSVLRSSVADTGVTAIQSLNGTLIGFVCATAIMLTVGDHRLALWVLLPILIFAAGLLPTVVNFSAGQAAFTVLVVVLFNLSDPVGWELGVVRLERVGLGAAVAVLVGVLMWPRGVSHGVARAVAAEYRTTIRYLGATLDTVLGRLPASASDLRAEHRAAVTAKGLAESELGDLMNSHGTKHVSVDTWGDLVSRPTAALIGADSLRSAATLQGRSAVESSTAATVTRVADALGTAADTFTDGVLSAADELAEAAAAPPGHHGTSPEPAPVDPRPTPSEVALADARSAVEELIDDRPTIAGLSDHQLLGLVSALEWLTFLHDLGVDVSSELSEASVAVSRSWWR